MRMVVEMIKRMARGGEGAVARERRGSPNTGGSPGTRCASPLVASEYTCKHIRAPSLTERRLKNVYF